MDIVELKAKIDYRLDDLEKMTLQTLGSSVGSLNITAQNKLITHAVNVFNEIVRLSGWKFLTLYRACSQWEFLQGVLFSVDPKDENETLLAYQDRVIAVADALRQVSFQNSFSHSLAGALFNRFKDFPEQAKKLYSPEDDSSMTIFSVPNLAELPLRLKFRTKEMFGHERFSMLLASSPIVTADESVRFEYILHAGVEFASGTSSLDLSTRSVRDERILTHILTRWRALLFQLAEEFEVKAKSKTQSNIELTPEQREYVNGALTSRLTDSEKLEAMYRMLCEIHDHRHVDDHDMRAMCGT